MNRTDDQPRDAHQSGLPAAAVDRRVGTYSKGMRQKVGIAMAIARRVQLFLLDEPTSGLDPKASNEFSELVTSLSEDGVGVLMATHDLFRAREIATRIGIMKQGESDQFSASDVTHQQLEKVISSRAVPHEGVLGSVHNRSQGVDGSRS